MSNDTENNGRLATLAAANSLLDSRQVVTSQNGEDGVIREIFSRIGVEHAFCVEFGAWDGLYLSNVWDLWHNQGWRAVLIEGNPERFATLSQTVAPFPGAQAVCAYVSISGERRLDEVLRQCEAPSNLDLVSIDIDGDDYYIFESLTEYRPRVVVIEFNPTVPPEIDMVQAPGEYLGSSARALVRLASAKGYKLAACTDTNCIFVTENDFPKLGIAVPALEEVFPRGALTYLMTGFDGAAFLSRRPPFITRMRRDRVPERTRLRKTLRVIPRMRNPACLTPAEDGFLPVRVFDAAAGVGARRWKELGMRKRRLAAHLRRSGS